MSEINQERRIVLYFRKQPEKDRFIFGDRWILPLLRLILRGRKIGGVEKVFINLCKAFDLAKIPYLKNIPFHQLQSNDTPIILGVGKYSLEGYKQSNPIIAGIGLMTHPAEWPDLLKKYPIKVYLQHSAWTQQIYKNYYGEHCKIWPVGIETDYWKPKTALKSVDVLIYDKILWSRENTVQVLLEPIKKILRTRGLSFEVVTYGDYKPIAYKKQLQQSKSMIFLCEHESQGIAYQEALAMDVPIAAWDQGYWLDPNRFKWNEKNAVMASSTPYFDETCGIKFRNISEFEGKFDTFFTNVNAKLYQPRKYVIENLSLNLSAKKMLEIIEETS